LWLIIVYITSVVYLWLSENGLKVVGNVPDCFYAILHNQRTASWKSTQRKNDTFN